MQFKVSFQVRALEKSDRGEGREVRGETESCFPFFFVFFVCFFFFFFRGAGGGSPWDAFNFHLFLRLGTADAEPLGTIRSCRNFLLFSLEYVRTQLCLLPLLPASLPFNLFLPSCITSFLPVLLRQKETKCLEQKNKNKKRQIENRYHLTFYG